MALAGEQHDVAGPGALEGRLDRRAPVGDEQQVVVAPPAGRLRAARDRVEDRLAVLAARILVGDDDEPAALAGDPAHQRALGRVALPGRAEDRDHARRRAAAASGAEQVEDGLERGRAVGEVDDDPERLAELDALHPTRARPATDARPVADGGRVEPERLAEGDDRERVVDVEPAGEAQVDASPRPIGRVVGDPQAARRPPRRGSRGRRPRGPCRR